MTVRFGRRVRKGAAGTAVAAAAMAALTASQAPGLAAGATHTASVPIADRPDAQIDGGGVPNYVQLPPLAPTSPGTAGNGTAPPGSLLGGNGVGLPTTVMAAYRNAEETLARTRASCHLPWQLLAAIGQVESGQARGGDVDAHGDTLHRILGPVLNGQGFADITDTDGGAWDGDPVHDRAVGPMQFIPSTWATWGADGNSDGVKNPNNVYDAALGAGDYLCAVGGDLADPARMARAILGYNHSQAYLDTVESWYSYFRKGVHEIPDHPGGTGSPVPGGTTPTARPSASASAPATSSPSHTPLPTASASGSVGPVKPTGGTTSPPASGSPSPSGSDCPTGSASPTPSGSVSPSPSPTGSGSPSPSGSPCATGSPSGSPTPSPSASGSVSPSPSARPSASASQSAPARPSTRPSTSAPAPATPPSAPVTVSAPAGS